MRLRREIEGVKYERGGIAGRSCQEDVLWDLVVVLLTNLYQADSSSENIFLLMIVFYESRFRRPKTITVKEGAAKVRTRVNRQDAPIAHVLHSKDRVINFLKFAWCSLKTICSVFFCLLAAATVVAPLCKRTNAFKGSLKNTDSGKR